MFSVLAKKLVLILFFFKEEKKKKKKNSGLVIYVVYGIKLQNYVPYNAFVWTIVHYAVVVSWIFYSVVLIIVCLCGLLLKYLNFMHFFFSGLVSVGSIFRKKQRIMGHKIVPLSLLPSEQQNLLNSFNCPFVAGL